MGGRQRFVPASKSFTVHGRNWLRDAAHIIETTGEGICLFVTLTVAGGTNEAFEALGIASGYIADRMNRWLRYKVAGGFYVYCWELQQRGAPHMHYLFRLPSDVDIVAFKLACNQEWRRILIDVSRESGVDVFRRLDGETWRDDPNKPRVNYVYVKRRYANYISKYTSKTKSKGGVVSPFRPTTWWGISASSRNAVAKERVEAILPIELLGLGARVQEMIVTAGGACCSMFKWVSPPERTDTVMLSFYVATGARRDVVAAIWNWFKTKSFEAFQLELADINRSYNTS